MRLFFAMPLPVEARERLRPVFESARRAAGNAVGFGKLEQLHFTLAFLGETSQLDAARAAGDGVRGLAGFEVAIAGAGAFPSPSRPRVLWLGVSEGGPQLVSAVERLCAGLRQRGFALEERRFHPHLTLGRVRPRGDHGARRALGAVPAGELARFAAREICLMQSVLGAGGAQHSVLESFALG